MVKHKVVVIIHIIKVFELNFVILEQLLDNYSFIDLDSYYMHFIMGITGIPNFMVTSASKSYFYNIFCYIIIINNTIYISFFPQFNHSQGTYDIYLYILQSKMVKRTMGKKTKILASKLTKCDIHCDNEHELAQLFDNKGKQHLLENHIHLHQFFLLIVL